MRRLILISSFMPLLLIDCDDIVGVGPFECHGDAPGWLVAKLGTLHDMWGTRVYRYEWRGEFVYYIEIPMSSCAYCELYDRDGKDIQFSDDDEFQDFLANKDNEVLVCEWKG